MLTEPLARTAYKTTQFQLIFYLFLLVLGIELVTSRFLDTYAAELFPQFH